MVSEIIYGPVHTQLISKQIKAIDPRPFKIEIIVTVLWESNISTSEFDKKKRKRETFR